MKVIHATECAASGTLNVIVALAHELAAAGAAPAQSSTANARRRRRICRRCFRPALSSCACRRRRGCRSDSSPTSGVRSAARCRTFARMSFTCIRQRRDFSVASSAWRAAGRVARSISPHGLAFLDPERRGRNAVSRPLSTSRRAPARSPWAAARAKAALLTKLSGRPALCWKFRWTKAFSGSKPCPRKWYRGDAGPAVAPEGAENFAAVARLARHAVRTCASSGSATAIRTTRTRSRPRAAR